MIHFSWELRVWKKHQHTPIYLPTPTHSSTYPYTPAHSSFYPHTHTHTLTPTHTHIHTHTNNQYEIAIVSTDKTAILDGPVASKTTWNIAGLVGLVCTFLYNLYSTLFLCTFVYILYEPVYLFALWYTTLIYNLFSIYILCTFIYSLYIAYTFWCTKEYLIL